MPDEPHGPKPAREPKAKPPEAAKAKEPGPRLVEALNRLFHPDLAPR
jgi:hypothetical protein